MCVVSKNDGAIENYITLPGILQAMRSLLKNLQETSKTINLIINRLRKCITASKSLKNPRSFWIFKAMRETLTISVELPRGLQNFQEVSRAYNKFEKILKHLRIFSQIQKNKLVELSKKKNRKSKILLYNFPEICGIVQLHMKLGVVL